MISKAIYYSEKCHVGTNHLYGNEPYSKHLGMVVQWAIRFIHLIPKNHRSNVIAACYLHDVIEDCRQTYNDVKKETNLDIAELVYALTNDKGKTRAERAGSKYYKGILAVPHAAFIKICDRLANFEYSSTEGSKKMARMYAKENPDFIGEIYSEENTEIIDFLEDIVSNYSY